MSFYIYKNIVYEENFYMVFISPLLTFFLS